MRSSRGRERLGWAWGDRLLGLEKLVRREELLRLEAEAEAGELADYSGLEAGG